jgi:hypothetical protein
MAERLHSIDGRKYLYPWHVWDSGEEHVIRRGEDFDVSVVSMIGALRQHATRAGMAVTARPVDNDTAVRFQFSQAADDDPRAA